MLTGSSPPPRLLAALLATTAAAALLASPAAAGDIVTGTIDNNDPAQTGFLARNSVASTCNAPKANPGVQPGNTSPFSYDTVAVVNPSGAQQCYTVTLSSPNVGLALFAAAYLGSFNPASPATNYLADPGATTNPQNPTRTFSFVLGAGQTAIVVVSEITSTSCAVTVGGCPWQLDIAAAPLAVTLRAFTATCFAGAVTLRWRTASEVETLGYNVYGLVRGKRVKLNRGVIASRGLNGGAYSFRYRLLNRTAVPTRYWLQVVNLDGSRTWYTSTLARRVQKPLLA